LIGPKRRWRAYKARVKQLPPDYRKAVDAIERYLMHYGPMDNDSAAAVFDAVADAFERAAADGSPIHDIVGDDPAEFVDALIRKYAKAGYQSVADAVAAAQAAAEGVQREQKRLTDSIARVARNQPPA
jgi:DNA-binding ferritin-like protein (Dps family)